MIPLLRGPAIGWISPSDQLPATPEGSSDLVLVTVERASGKRYAFPAVYCNRFELTWNDGGVAGKGKGYQISLDENGDQFATGWFTVKERYDEDEWYEALLAAGDTLIAWQLIPAPLQPEPIP